ncbi:MAG: diacylglycerol kinase family protein [bacterium]
MRNILIFYNPYAGRQALVKPLKFLTRQIIKHGDNYLAIDQNPADLRVLPKVEGQSADLVVVFGGDGTVRAVAQLILSNHLSMPLAIIPFGSANILASALGIPLTIKKAINVALKGKPLAIDVGLLNSRHYFLVSFVLGYVSQIIKKTPRGIKKYLSFLGYVFIFLRSLKFSLADFNLKVDGHHHVITGNSVIVFNALAVFGLKPKPKLDFQDGQLDLFALTNKRFLSFFEVLSYFFIDRKLRKHFVNLRGRQISLAGHWGTDMPITIDGDVIEMDSKTISIETLPKHLKIIVRAD